MSSGGRIGVLTFHRCINYGSYWQARQLVEGLISRGFDAVLLDHRSERIDRAEWRCALQPLLPAHGRRGDRRLYARKARQFIAAVNSLPLSPPFHLEGDELPGRFDRIVIGSDEVWNTDHPWYGSHDRFFGARLACNQLVAYAASCGSRDRQSDLDDARCAQLRGFAHLSVRDGNSQELVHDATGRMAPIVLDPCLAFVPAVPDRTQDAGRYIALYGHGFPGWFARRVIAAARETECPVISIGYRNDWADAQWLDAGPLDFAPFMASATAVATGFFHGCVFALVHDRPFLCVSSPYRANKLVGLMRLVGTPERLVDENASIGAVNAHLSVPPGPAIATRLDRLRTLSKRYLDHALA